MLNSYDFKLKPWLVTPSEEIPETLSKYKKINQLQDECVHEISTGIKAPLLRLQAQISRILKAQKKGQITALEMEDRLIKAENQCASMSQVIDQLIDLSCESNHQLEIKFQETNICNVAADVIERLLDQAIAKNSQIFLSCPKVVVGMFDPQRIDQIFNHLILNAIKFAPASDINVRLTSDQNLAIIEVSDNGPGIPVDKQSEIFERFTKLNDSSNGFGLGLWFVKGIVNRFGGTIDVNSSYKEGTTFTIKLPLQNLHH